MGLTNLELTKCVAEFSIASTKLHLIVHLSMCPSELEVSQYLMAGGESGDQGWRFTKLSDQWLILQAHCLINYKNYEVVILYTQLMTGRGDKFI